MSNKFATKIFAALSNEARLVLLQKLIVAGSDGLDVSQLSSLTERNIKTISAQLKVLSEAEILSSQRFGKRIVYKVEYKALSNVISFLAEDCCCGYPSKDDVSSGSFDAQPNKGRCQ